MELAGWPLVGAVLVLAFVAAVLLLPRVRRQRQAAGARRRARDLAQAVLDAYRAAKASAPLPEDELWVRALVDGLQMPESEARAAATRARSISTMHATLQQLVVAVAVDRERDRLSEPERQNPWCPAIPVVQSTVMGTIPLDLSAASLLPGPVPAITESDGVTFDQALEMSDPTSAMLEIAVMLERKAAAAEIPLSHEEKTVRLVTGLDCQVGNGGWYQWLCNTSAAAIGGTPDALREVGCSEIEQLAREAVAIAGLDLAQHSDEGKDQKLDQIGENELERLDGLDTQLSESAEDPMAACRDYLLRNRGAFSL
jgi:type II secretory pathway pseudopilin PulG